MSNKYLEKIAEIHEDLTGNPRPKRKGKKARLKKKRHDWTPAAVTGASDLASGVATGVVGGLISDRYFKGKYAMPLTAGIGATVAAGLADHIQRDREKR